MKVTENGNERNTKRVMKLLEKADGVNDEPIDALTHSVTNLTSFLTDKRTDVLINPPILSSDEWVDMLTN